MNGAVLAAARAVDKTFDALTGGEESRDVSDDVTALAFAGMDVPAQLVLEILERNAGAYAERVPEYGAREMLKTVQVQAFLFGFECARRAAGE